jgi:anaerobic magnesium-protoporphyrin IX monomethyl ester cyclase
MKVDLIFPQHEGVSNIQVPQPSTGLLTLAAYAQQNIPRLDVTVYDGNYISNADIVGVSTWFSNYSNALSIGKEVKRRNPKATLIFGGPHAGSIPKRVISNNPFVDYVISGDGERAFVKLLGGEQEDKVPGLTYRKGNRVTTNNPDFTVDLETIPAINFQTLGEEFIWKPKSRSYIPISLYRGCFRSSRCEYCSLPIESTRKSSPDAFWRQVRVLKEGWGVDSFFETADIFPLGEAKKLIAARPEELEGVQFRVYIYPSTVNKQRAENLADLGVTSAYMGVENVLHFPDSSFYQKGLNRTFKRGYTIDSLVEEIALLGENGIRVMPGFVLGIPGETDDSLEANLNLIQRVTDLPKVIEASVNTLIPLPGSAYFEIAISNENILRQYFRITGLNLTEIDQIDFQLLARLFIEEFTSIDYGKVKSILDEIKSENISHWSE